MTRFLLTLLALLTGLANSSTPAQARVCEVGEAEVGAVELSRATALIAAQATVASVRAEPGERRIVAAHAVDFQDQAVLTPTVRPGVDRARE